MAPDTRAGRRPSRRRRSGESGSTTAPADRARDAGRPRSRSRVRAPRAAAPAEFPPRPAVERNQRGAGEHDQQADQRERCGGTEAVSAAALRGLGLAVSHSGHCRQFAVSAAGANFSACRRQRRIKLYREIARGGGRARPEAEQIEAFHRDEGLVGGNRRHREGGMQVHGFGVQQILAALDREHDVGLRRDDRLVVDDLVAVITVDGIDGAGERDDFVRGGVLARGHGPATQQRHHEHHAHRLCHPGAQFAQLRQIAGHGGRQAFGALVGVHGVTDQFDFVDQARFRECFRHQHQRHFRRFQHVHGFLRAGSLHREHQRRVQSQHAFGRKLAHVADIGFVAQRGCRIEAGRIDAGEPVLEAERIENFGDGAADRDDARGIFDRDIAVARVVDGNAGRRMRRCRARSAGGRSAARCASVRQNVIGGSLGQDQLVLRRQPQAIILVAMGNDDLAFGRKQLAAVDPVAVHDHGSRCSRRIFRMRSGAVNLSPEVADIVRLLRPEIKTCRSMLV